MSRIASGGGGSAITTFDRFPDADPRSEVLASNETFTIPTGETWLAYLQIQGLTSNGNVLDVDGVTYVDYSSFDEFSPKPAVLKSGTEIFVDGFDGATVAGVEASSRLVGDPLTYTATSNFSVPSGETWFCHVRSADDLIYDPNGSSIAVKSYEQPSTQLVMRGGDVWDPGNGAVFTGVIR